MMDYKNKKIMILGAGTLQVPLLKRAKEKGLFVIVVSPSLKQPGIEYADDVIQLDVRDEEGILKAAEKYGIDGITTDQTDLPVRTAAYVSEHLGLPGIGYKLGCLFTDKYLMREECMKLGLPTPRYKLINDIKDAFDFFHDLDNLAILKPSDSQSSNGVVKITNESQIEKAVNDAKKFTRSGRMIMEEWIEGEEFPVDSYVVDGKCHLLSIGKYHPFENKEIPTQCSYKTVFPADITEGIRKVIADTNKKIVEGFGLPFGRTHAEYIVSGDKAYLVEIGARGGGSFFSSDNIRYVTGFRTEDFLIDAALGANNQLELEDESERSFCCCTLFFCLPENGVIVSIEGKESVLSMSFVHRNMLNSIHVGYRTAPIENKGSRFNIVVTADSYGQLEDRIEWIRRTLKIQTRLKNGDIEQPIWN
jgi:carbamoyl-phosphate synthase large subunit